MRRRTKKLAVNSGTVVTFITTQDAALQGLIAVLLKIQVFWGVTPCPEASTFSTFKSHLALNMKRTRSFETSGNTRHMMAASVRENTNFQLTSYWLAPVVVVCHCLHLKLLGGSTFHQAIILHKRQFLFNISHSVHCDVTNTNQTNKIHTL